MLILQKDPKFSVRKLTNKQVFQVDTERMLRRHREGGHKEKRKKEKSRLDKTETGYTRGALNNWVSGKTGHDGKMEVASEVDQNISPHLGGKKQRKEDVLYDLWNEDKNKYVYDPVSNSVNFSKRKPTDYKLNKFVILPRPLDSDGEFLCEIRRN